MTAINPEDRYQSLEDVERDLVGSYIEDERSKNRDSKPRVRVKNSRKDRDIEEIPKNSTSFPMFAIFGVVYQFF